MTNAAAIGYMIMALERLKRNGCPIDQSDINDAEHLMKHYMDVYTEEEAEDKYHAHN